MSHIDFLMLGLFPYVAMLIFLLGSLIRYDREQYSWKTSSSQLIDGGWQLRWGSNLFHIGIIAILLGHVVGLLTPKFIFELLGVSSSAKQIMAISIGGFFGLICFAGMVLLIHRRLFNPRVRANSSFMDTSILLLIFAQLLLGMAGIPFSLGHLDGSVMLLLMEWAQSLVLLQPVVAAEAAAPVHGIYKAHIVLGFTLFVLFPFSRLVHIWSIPLGYITRSYQVVRAKVAS